MADLDFSGLKPIEPALDYSGLKPLDYSGLKPLEEEPTTAGAFGRGAVRGAVPAAGGMAGAGAGLALGTAAAPFLGPLAPLGPPVGALIGGFGGGYAVGQAQEAALNLLPEAVRNWLGQSPEQRAKDVNAHKYAAMLGEIFPQAAFLRPGLGLDLAGRAIGAGVSTGLEGAQQAIHGEFDPQALALSAGAGALMNKPTAMGTALTKAGARMVGRGAPSVSRETPPGEAPTETPPVPKELPPPGVPFGYQFSPNSPPQRLTITRLLDDGTAEIVNTAGVTATVPTPTLLAGLTSDPGVTRIMGQETPLGATPSPEISPEAAEAAAQAREISAQPEILGQRVPLGTEAAEITQEAAEAAAAVREAAAQPEILGQRVPPAGPTTPIPPDALEAAKSIRADARNAEIMGQRIPGRTEPQFSPEEIQSQEEMASMARDLLAKAGPQAATRILGTQAPPRPPEQPISPEDAARAAELRKAGMPAQQPGMIPPEAYVRAPETITFTPEEIARAVQLLRQQREAQARQSQPSLPEALAADIAQRAPVAPARAPEAPIAPTVPEPGTRAIGEPAELDEMGFPVRRRPAVEAPPPEPAPPELPAITPPRSVRSQVEDAIIPANGRSFPVEYRIRDIRELIPSNLDDLRPNPNYDQTLQPRSREGAATEAQINSILNGAGPEGRFRPELLGEIPDATTGAPTTLPDGHVISGNARTIALRRAYDQNLPAAEAYRSWLASQGYPVEGIQFPILERVIRSDMERPQLQQLARDLNVPGVASMKASEQARADAAQIPDDVFRSYQGGDIFSAGNQRFVRSVLGSFANTRDFQALGETLSPEGQKRVQNAVLAKAYNDPALIEKLIDDADVNIKAIGKALGDAAASWAQLRSAIAAGRVEREYDISNDLIDAVRLVSRARDEGRNIAEYIQQPGLFGEAGPLTAEGQEALRWMLGPDKNGVPWQRKYGQAKIADAIKAYSDNAQVTTAGAKPSPRDLAGIAREQGQGAIRELFSPQVEIGQGPGAVREEPGTGGAEVQRPGVGTERAAEPARGKAGEHTDTTAEFNDIKRTLDDYYQSYGGAPENGVSELARNYVMNKGAETGNEYYAVYDPKTGDVITTGTTNEKFTVRVEVPSEALSDPDGSLVIHHNHPSERSLSGGDLRMLSHDGIGWVVAHSHDGELYGAQLTPEVDALIAGLAPQGDAARNLGRSVVDQGIGWTAKAAKAAVLPSLEMQKKSGKLSPEDASQLTTHLINRALDAAGIVDYVHTLSELPLSEAVQSSIVRRGAIAARKAASDHGLVSDRRSESDYRARIDRSANALRPDEAIARISGGDVDAQLARSAGSPGGGGAGVGEAGGAPVRTNAVVGGGYLEDRPVIIDRAAAQLNDLTTSTKGITKKVADELQLWAAPMAAGSFPQQAIAKDFANFERGARYQRTVFDDRFKKYSEEDRQKMWDAADRASVAVQVGGPEAAWPYLRTLTPAQIADLVELDRYSHDLWARGQKVGLVTGEALPFYTTRAVFNVGKDGAEGQAGTGGLDQLGINLRTRGVERRKYLTAEETEAAAKARFGPEAQIFRDIRAVPWALERFERAIATKELINKIDKMSILAGKETVVGDDRPGYFTLPHPAFQKYGPRFTTNAEGKTVPVMDAEGRPIMERKPIYILKEFEGPLRSVLRHKDGELYKAAMKVKAGGISLIMNSPMIHNIVEYGRALPLMPGKVGTLAIYFEGNAFRRGLEYKNPIAHIADKLAGRQEDTIMHPEMREAIYEGGYAPIGHRGYLQDIAGMAEEPNLPPGRSMTAKVLGGIGDAFHPRLGTEIKKAVDVAGDWWHNKLLWDRIADLQAGLYVNMRDKLMADYGLERRAAVITAAHFANRYAGALPNEAMGEAARKLANVVLFSRSFKLGNLGVMKDMFTGLPRDAQAQIRTALGAEALKRATSVAKSKARATFMVDIGLFYLTNAMLQAGLGMMMQDKSLSDVEKEYGGTLQRALNRIYEHPLDALNPLETIASFSPLFDNEPQKQDRVLWTYAKDGTALYLRSPLGKIGEEFAGWIDHPLQMLRQGEGTIARPITNIIANDRGFDRKVYDPDAKGLMGKVDMAARIMWEFMRSQIPETQFNALWKMATGTSREGDVSQALLPFAGLTVSRGAPGGPSIGLMYQQDRERKQRLQDAMPKIDEMIRAGNTAEAAAQLRSLGMPEGLVRYRLRTVINPQSRMSARALQDFMRSATPEQREQMQRMKERQPTP